MFKSKSQTYVTENYIIAICQGSKSLSYHLSLLDQIAIRYYQPLMYCPFTMHVNHVKPKTFCYSVRIVLNSLSLKFRRKTTCSKIYFFVCDMISSYNTLVNLFLIAIFQISNRSVIKFN